MINLSKTIEASIGKEYESSETRLNSELNSFLEHSVNNLNIGETPFFAALKSGQMTKSQFLDTQIDFSYAVQYFSRPMAMCIANIPDAEMRMPIVANLWEEHGKGDKNNIHGQTILTLINRLGCDISKINLNNTPINVNVFNQLLRGAAIFEDYKFSASMFGAIERLFAEISGHIHKAIVRNRWLTSEKVTHYGLHKDLDIQHAEEFMLIVDKEWENPESKKQIQQGVLFGLEIFSNLYTGFYAKIDKKTRAEIHGIENV